MIAKRFDPALEVLDATRRNHPVDLAGLLARVIRHLTGLPDYVPDQKINEAACGFLRDDKLARSKPLRLRLVGLTEIIVTADGKLCLRDATDDFRFGPLWTVLTYGTVLNGRLIIGQQDNENEEAKAPEGD